MRAHREQMIGRKHLSVRHLRGLLGNGRGHDDRFAIACRLNHRRQQAVDGAQIAGKRELTVELVVVERLHRYLAGCSKDAECDRQVKARAFFRQVRRRQIDRYTTLRPIEIRVQQRRTHTVPALAHRRFRQADNVGSRQTARKMHFDVHARRFNAECRTRMHDGEAHAARPRHATEQHSWVLWRTVVCCMSLIAGCWRETQTRGPQPQVLQSGSEAQVRRFSIPAPTSKSPAGLLRTKNCK